jgi:hypothetical protein
LQAASSGLPSWIYKRDGSLAPFEADKISRSLFAATESLGSPNAFLARELADSVLHFLRGEADTAIPSSAQVAELVEKVVRELGQPALAQEFADWHERRALVKAGSSFPSDQPKEEKQTQQIQVGPTLVEVRGMLEKESSSIAYLREAGGACLREYSLSDVFTRDLTAAIRDGFLTLTGLETPRELFATVLDTGKLSSEGVLATLENARETTGQWLAIDGLEYAVVSSPRLQNDFDTEVGGEISAALRMTGLKAAVNCNCASPPPWTNDLAKGPLFSQPGESPRWEKSADIGAALAEKWLQTGSGEEIRIDWHLCETDFKRENQGSLLSLARHALEGRPILFVFDRPRRPMSLAEGLDRNHPAVLLQVGVNLPKLLEQPGARADPDKFLSKLGSLARLALSAGAQKRDYLRKSARNRRELTRGFLLDRARLVVVPVGLDAVVRELTAKGICNGGASLDFGEKIVKTLQEVLIQDGRASHLETGLDSAWNFSLTEQFQRAVRATKSLQLAEVAGLTGWDGTALGKNQSKAAGVLHSAAETGTAALLVNGEEMISPETLIDLLRHAFAQTAIVRLQIIKQIDKPLVTGKTKG